MGGEILAHRSEQSMLEITDPASANDDGRVPTCDIEKRSGWMRLDDDRFCDDPVGSGGCGNGFGDEYLGLCSQAEPVDFDWPTACHQRDRHRHMPCRQRGHGLITSFGDRNRPVERSASARRAVDSDNPLLSHTFDYQRRPPRCVGPNDPPHFNRAHFNRAKRERNNPPHHTSFAPSANEVFIRGCGRGRSPTIAGNRPQIHCWRCAHTVRCPPLPSPPRY